MVGLFERSADEDEHPILLATQSDTLLDALSEPVGSTRICELDETGGTIVKNLDAGSLKEWLGEYRGIGTLRARGELEQAYRPATSPGGFAAIDRLDAGTAAE